MESPRAGEDKIFVAVGNVMKESISTLLWALKNFRGKNFSILHVHQPAQEIRVLGVKFRAEGLDMQQVRTHREVEKIKMLNILDEYLDICSHAGVLVEQPIYIEMDNIEKGIVELIAQHGITKLVMGAAADKHYSKNMARLKSQKANFIFQKAPIWCHIWFVCRDKLIVTREGVSERTAMEATTSSPSFSQNNGLAENLAQESLRRAKTVKCDTTGGSVPSPRAKSQSPTKLTNPFQDFLRRTMSRKESSSSGGTTVIRTPRSSSPITDHSSQLSYGSSSARILRDGRSHDETVLPPLCKSNENLSAISLEKKSENLHEKEEKKGRELEQLERERQELEKLKSQRDQVMEELRIAQDHKIKLESQIADSDQVAQRLAAIQKEFDELQKLRIIQEEEFASFQRSQFFSVFSALDIQSATVNFNTSMKIGEGGFGNVYKGLLRQTPVAIKRFHYHSLEGQSSSDFQREVDVLSKVRHPNLVTLIGTCPEVSSLVLEYLPNGSLEDRLNCKNGTPPLSWKTRMRIAKQICSALIFLHSNKPISIVHGDLKPSNILLDSNFVTKLGDFGIASFIENSTYTTTLCCTADPKGTVAYIDPEFLATGVLTPKADVYAYGVVLLQLLTGRPAKGLPKTVQFALDQGTLNAMLDASAGDWPLVQAKQLAQMALRCCEFYRENRPNLEFEVFKLLRLLETEI